MLKAESLHLPTRLGSQRPHSVLQYSATAASKKSFSISIFQGLKPRTSHVLCASVHVKATPRSAESVTSHGLPHALLPLHHPPAMSNDCMLSFANEVLKTQAVTPSRNSSASWPEYKCICIFLITFLKNVMLCNTLNICNTFIDQTFHLIKTIIWQDVA